MANADVFDTYFRQADSDRDGRISGAEAVMFFRGSNLPQPVLAKIWQYSDQRKSGFLSRAEFYHALKLVTVAQSGRELTPEIVQAAFAGPASSQIPAPRIASGPSSALPINNNLPLQVTRMNNAVQQPPGLGLTSHYPLMTPNQTTRPAFLQQLRPTTQESVQNFATTSLGIDSWAPSKSSSSEVNGVKASNMQSKVNPVQSAAGISAQGAMSTAFNDAAYRTMSNNSTASSVLSTIGPPVSSQFDNLLNQDFISKNDSVKKSSNAGLGTKGLIEESLIDFSGEVSTAPGISASPGGLLEVSSQATSGTADVKVPEKVATPAGPSNEAPASLVAPHPVLTLASAVDLGVHEVSTPSSPLHTVGAWPKMSKNDVERFSRIFFQVDTDRDGKISGLQARDLFLSWRLPREVLKQVWDLSDQDGDSMLSLQEFCTALYLMERHREGRPLPPVLPAGIHSEDNIQWQSANASQVPRQVTGSTESKASSQISLQAPSSDGVEAGSKQERLYKSKAPTLEMDLVKQLSKDEQENLKSKQKDADEADKKVYELEKDIMESQKQIEVYRTKLQELILLKSRSDNRLAEVTERSAAEKREIENLARKYDAKFRQAGEVNSRLQAEEAMFRDIQERKMELYNAIAQIGQRDLSNPLPQAHVDRLIADLGELKKILTTRAKEIGLRLRPPPLSNATFGGQLENQESFFDWDDDWDKFDDEGFASLHGPVNDIITNSEAMEVPTSNPVFGWDKESLFDDRVELSSESHFENKVEVDGDESLIQHPTPAVFDSPRAESEPESRRSSIGSPQQDILSPGHQHLGTSGIGGIGDSLLTRPKSRYDSMGESQDFDAGNESFWPPNRTMFNSDIGDADKQSSWQSEFGGTKYEIESDIGDPWDLRSTSIQTATGGSTTNFTRQTGIRPIFDSHSFSDSLDFGNLRISTAIREDVAKDENDFFGTTDATSWRDRFETSMPGTPLFKADSPVTTSSLLGDEFNTEPRAHSRFDSISSPVRANRLRGLGSFDEGDPFAGTGPFGLTSQSSKSSEHWGAF